MIRFIIIVLIIYAIYNIYKIYEDIKTPIYNSSINSKYLNNGKGGRKKSEKEKKDNNNIEKHISHLENSYLYKPYKNFLSKFDKINYRFYLSCNDHIELNKLFSVTEKEYAEQFINVYNINDKEYHWDDSKIEKKKIFFFFKKNIYPSFDIVIPNKLCKKKKGNVYLHIVTFVNKQLYRYGTSTIVLTKKKLGEDVKNEKRFLWERFMNRSSEEKEKGRNVKEKKEKKENEKEEKNDHNKKKKKGIDKEGNIQKKKKKDNALYIPKIIQFGPVIEHHDIDIKYVSYFSNIYIDKYKNTYYLPLYVNNYLTPEDEYQLFYSPDEKGVNDDKKNPIRNKNNTKNDDNRLLLKHSIKIEYVPITYTYFNLFNMIIFSIDAIKQKFNFGKYDLDSLAAFLCGNIYVALIIYLTFFLHMLLDIIAIYFDMKSWRSGTYLYSFSSNTIHLNIIFTFIIFLYLQDKNESKIIMLFVLLKFLVCLWKLKKLYSIRFLLFYPYICIKKNCLMNNESTAVDEFEKKLIKKLCYLMTVVILFISIYNFIYNKYESFYSLIISSLAIYSYFFSFIYMLPKVIRNYYTKTVDHMSLFSLFLLFLNTFIDDIFVLFIRMPKMHKYSLFRDDIIFIIFLIQYRIYKKNKVYLGKKRKKEIKKKNKLKALTFDESKKDK